MYKKIYITVILIILFISPAYSFTQKCMFVVAQDPLTDGDQIIHDKLVEWGYHVTPVLSSKLVSFILADYEAYDFIFTSESVGSSSLAPLKLIPKPLVNSESWASKPSALAWCDPATSESMAPEPIVILDEAAGHPLAAGFSPGDVLNLTTDPAGLIVAVIPTIDVIPIASYVSDSSKLLIFGIESGTTLTDGSITGNRAALVGIHEFGYLSITEAGWAFFQAAINWVTALDSDIENRGNGTLVDFKLAQNFPNPFNNVTTIRYHITHDVYVKLTIFDMLGREVKTLVNNHQIAGIYQIKWDSSSIASGMYFYKLHTGAQQQICKMSLLK